MNGKIIKRLSWAMMTLILTACSEILPEQKFSCSKGHRATVQLNVSTASEMEVSGTRGEDIKPGSVKEGTEDNYKVSDFWLLEYGADGKLVEADGKPAIQYVTRDDLEKKNHRLDIQLPNGNDDKYRCVMIANTHDENFFSGSNVSSYETIDKLSGLTKEVKSLSRDTYNNDGGKEELYLNCVTDVSNTSKILKCVFYRNVAKLTVKVKNDSNSEMEITGIQICNVPNRMAYADQLLYDSRDEDAKMAAGARVIDMPREDIHLEAKKKKQNIELVYYLPRNCQGIDEDMKDGEEDQKNKSTKNASATCVKVFATDTESDIPYCYTFYIGKNMANDFNVEPNCHYRLPISIKNVGKEDDDSRIESLYEHEDGTMGANCIMMDLSDKNKVYTIYPHKRINKFWGEVVGDATRTIKKNQRWTAEIIWQDIPDDAIEFVKSGTETLDGKGMLPLKIRLKRSLSTPCNVLIGVKKRDARYVEDGYLWSWHLWITPYKPDRTAGWIPNQYEYIVQHGKVFRYAPGVEGSQDNDLWKPGGEYYNKYIMDRNLGATTPKTPTPGDDLIKAAGMCYLYGRKDPFLAAREGPLYKQRPYPPQLMDSTKVLRTTSDVIFPYDVMFPFEVHNSYEKKDWLRKSTAFSDNDWYNPFPKEEEFKNKSFFDPCPEGWRIPLPGTWNVSCKARVVHYEAEDVWWKVVASYPSDEEKIADWDKYVNGPFIYNKGLNLNIGDGTVTYYPAGGERFLYGQVWREGRWGCYWTSSMHKKLKRPFAFEFRKIEGEETTGLLFPIFIESNRAYGYNIRCVQE